MAEGKEDGGQCSPSEIGTKSKERDISLGKLVAVAVRSGCWSLPRGLHAAKKGLLSQGGHPELFLREGLSRARRAERKEASKQAHGVSRGNPRSLPGKTEVGTDNPKEQRSWSPRLPGDSKVSLRRSSTAVV